MGWDYPVEAERGVVEGFRLRYAVLHGPADLGPPQMVPPNYVTLLVAFSPNWGQAPPSLEKLIALKDIEWGALGYAGGRWTEHIALQVTLEGSELRSGRISGLLSGLQYQITLRAINGVGESPPSPPAQGFTLSNFPPFYMGSDGSERMGLGDLGEMKQRAGLDSIYGPVGPLQRRPAWVRPLFCPPPRRAHAFSPSLLYFPAAAFLFALLFFASRKTWGRPMRVARLPLASCGSI